ncbi:hypothetical protein H0I76_04570 [Limibaculum sp. M0105]|uniref:UspA domain-containing protein n=1 Tax=Thermohalobaculum xanthum TaxID=2753746 RepID=A0A8J7M5Y6_9RHOB|nr:hypothetical protein [Thermohalobaculum xanthum]MBK0398452.1 hypothetical protein [Thermohalobaculum xanthum]
MTTSADPSSEGENRLAGALFSRVLVALTGTEGSAVLIETACLAARATDAEVAGVYVREQALADLVALPFATILAPGRGEAETVSPEAVERAWARAEAACRNALHALLPARPAPFETVAGRMEAVIAGRAAPGDLVVLGAGAGLWPTTSEALVKAAAANAGAVLLVPAGISHRRGPIVAIDDGDLAGSGTVRLAARIARAGHRRLALLALAAPGGHEALAVRARTLTDGPFSLHGWPVDRADEIADAIACLAPSMVVADLSGAPFEGGGALERALRRIRAPVLLLSGDAARRMAGIPAP